jgi:hydroxypyruvate isomerase
MTTKPISRRTFVQTSAVALATVASPMLTAAQNSAPAKLKGNIHQSVCPWCYPKIKLDDLCAAGKDMGLVAVDLLDPPDFATAKKHGLPCSMVAHPTLDGIGGIDKAFNRIEHHDKLEQAYRQRLQETADAGYERLICFSGNRGGLDDARGLDHCEIGLKRILPLAEKLKVTLCMELLNSKRTHPDYQCDHVAWGVELVKRLSSERFKLLYDIFHMQIMEGDICDTIRENHPYFDHYHTGGVPGRNEIDETQELHYPRIMQAILATGYRGYVAQEFVPKHPDALASLRQAVTICDA